jgi:hypothetical protein
LIAEDHEVISLDCLLTGRVDNIRHLRGHPQSTFITHDQSDKRPGMGANRQPAGGAGTVASYFN